MTGILKLLLNNQKTFQDNQKTLQKKLDDQEKELTSLRNVSEEDSVDEYDGGMSSVDFRPRRRKKKERTDNYQKYAATMLTYQLLQNPHLQILRGTSLSARQTFRTKSWLRVASSFAKRTMVIPLPVPRRTTPI